MTRVYLCYYGKWLMKRHIQKFIYEEMVLSIPAYSTNSQIVE